MSINCIGHPILLNELFVSEMFVDDFDELADHSPDVLLGINYFTNKKKVTQIKILKQFSIPQEDGHNGLNGVDVTPTAYKRDVGNV